MYYVFKSPKVLKKINDYSQGITSDRLRLYFHDFAEVPLAIHAKPEQDLIADVFRTWDNGINLVEQAITKQHERFSWLRHQLLTGIQRLPGFEKPWSEVHLRDIFKPVRRKNEKGLTHVLTVSGEFGLIDQTKYFNRSVAGESLEGYFLLRHGEFAYNRSSMNGYPYGAIKRLDDYEEGVLSTLYICFKKASDRCHSDFYKHFLDAGILNRQLKEIVQIGARAHGLLNITAHDFFLLKVPCPLIEEQKQIATILNIADCELNLLRQQLDALHRQKKGLMQQLLLLKKE